MIQRASNILEFINKLRLKLVGHVARMSAQDVPLLAMVGGSGSSQTAAGTSAATMAGQY